jgi:hypothetical protein
MGIGIQFRLFATEGEFRVEQGFQPCIHMTESLPGFSRCGTWQVDEKYLRGWKPFIRQS